MKKRITLIALIGISFATISFINYGKQTDKFPQIQKYLESVKKINMDGEIMQISQKLKGKIFTCNTIWDIGDKKNFYYENMNWESFSSLEFKELKENNKYTICIFYFGDKMKLTTTHSFESTPTNSTENINYFTCYIFTKDKKEVEKIMEEFEKNIE